MQSQEIEPEKWNGLLGEVRICHSAGAHTQKHHETLELDETSWNQENQYQLRSRMLHGRETNKTSRGKGGGASWLQHSENLGIWALAR